ncbi:hypothetical protein [Deinococcus xianganensis]|uniref:Uncharacterized protein n=2 Tax=Deinococcus TaxID=1298 RepID=A0A6I4Y8Z7_9DEIO|nr:hypothetical protein [Deinococcus xianganensis]MXV18859.1 hypothetical protein [Deinococcus xianganensis]GGR98222.1 hypothetical protein GCM10008960_26070 [Deinococcus sedimenti]
MYGLRPGAAAQGQDSVKAHPVARAGGCYPGGVKEFLNDWWRLLKLIVGSLAIPVVLWLLLVWAGVLR